MATKSNSIIEDLQRSIERLTERVEKLEAEMYKREFWRRPVPPKPVLPMARAFDTDWYNEPGPEGMVHIRYKYACPCGQTHEAVQRVHHTTPPGFSKVVTCHNKQIVEVVFPQR